MTQVKRQQISTPSHLLTNEENLMLAKILGPRCPSLATAVVQIYMSDSASGLFTKNLDISWEDEQIAFICLESG